MRTTVNLLSPERKKNLQNAMIMAYSQTMVTLLFVAVVLVTAALFSVRLLLSNNYGELKRQSESAASEESTNIMENIRQINAFLKRVESTQTAFIPWAETFEQLTPLVPRGVHLERLSITGEGNINMSGIADTRDAALILLKNLKESPHLKDVVSPLSNIMQKTDVRFDFQMKYVAEQPAL